MVELGGRNVGIYTDAANIEGYWRDVEDNRQQRWTNNEVRSERNRAQLQQRELSAYDLDFYRQNAGLFDDRSGMLASVGQRNVPNAVPTSGAAAATTAAATGPAQLLGAPGGDPPAAAPAAAPARTAPPGAAATTPAATSGLTPEQIARLRASGRGSLPADVSSLRPLTLTGTNASQNTAISTYTNMVTRFSEGRIQQRNLAPVRNSLDTLVRTRVMTQAQADAELQRIESHTRPVARTAADADPTGLIGPEGMNLPDRFGINTDGTNSEVAAADTTADTDAAGATAEDAYFQGIGDTSRPLQPTPEMQMAGAMTRRLFERAQIYARNGNAAGSDQAFAGALQGQVAYIQAARGVLFQAAAAGSRDAAARLIADTSGLDPSAVQIQATPEREPRFIVRINTAGAGEPPNWVSNFSTPQGRDSFVNTLLNLYDRSGAAGRAEASQANYEAMLRYRATIAEVGGRDRVSIRDSLTRAEIAQLDSDTQMALAQGQGRMLQDSETGAVWLTRPGVGADGRPTVITTLLRIQDVRTANVDGEEETVQAGVRQDVY